MGGRGGASGFSQSGGSGAGGNSTRTGGGQSIKTLSKTDFNNWLDSQSVNKFISDEPSRIVINGVPLTLTDSYKSAGSGSYVRVYQSEQQASNGEYPTAEIVIKRRRRGKTTSYAFDRSNAGSKLW